MRSFVKPVTLLLMVVLAVAVPLDLVAAQSSPGPRLSPGPMGNRGSVETGPDGMEGEDPAVVAASEVYVDPAGSSVVSGDVFTVEIMKNTEEALGAFNLHVTWDISKLHLVDVRPGANVEAGTTFTYTERAPSVVHITAFALPGAELVAAGTGAMAEMEFEAADPGTSVVDVIDEEEAVGIPVYEPVELADTDQNPLPAPEVSDGTVTIASGAKIFLPIILRN